MKSELTFDAEVVQFLGFASDAKKQALADRDPQKAAEAILWIGYAASSILGKEVVELAAPPEGEDQIETLERLRRELVCCQHMLPSYRRLDDEITAAISGDEPRLFRRWRKLKGHPVNAYRLAKCELRANFWDDLLEVAGCGPAEDRHQLIAKAFGRPWATISKWPEKARERFGSDFVDFGFSGKAILSTRPNYALADWLDCMRADGEAYLKEVHVGAGKRAAQS